MLAELSACSSPESRYLVQLDGRQADAIRRRVDASSSSINQATNLHTHYLDGPLSIFGWKQARPYLHLPALFICLAMLPGIIHDVMILEMILKGMGVRSGVLG
jgi:hypothetical protein